MYFTLQFNRYQNGKRINITTIPLNECIGFFKRFRICNEMVSEHRWWKIIAFITFCISKYIHSFRVYFCRNVHTRILVFVLSNVVNLIINHSEAFNMNGSRTSRVRIQLKCMCEDFEYFMTFSSLSLSLSLSLSSLLLCVVFF
jgi:hypothetical protein